MKTRFLSLLCAFLVVGGAAIAQEMVRGGGLTHVFSRAPLSGLGIPTSPLTCNPAGAGDAGCIAAGGTQTITPSLDLLGDAGVEGNINAGGTLNEKGFEACTTGNNLCVIQDGGVYITATTAPLTLYVNGGLGNDSHACTAPGAAACATIQGALNKAPRVLRHGLVVNVAAGNYTGFYISGFSQDSSFQQNFPDGITINGTMANSTLATGTATGTLTGTTVGSGTTFATVSDSVQTWTVNNLRGRFLVFTSGPYSGAIIPIYSNTATSITYLDPGNGGLVGSTYAIQEPSTVITTAVPDPSGFVPNYTGAMLTGTPGLYVTIQEMGFSPGAANYGINAQGSGQLLLLFDQFKDGPTIGNINVDEIGPIDSLSIQYVSSASTNTSGHFSHIAFEAPTVIGPEMIVYGTMIEGGSNGLQVSSIGAETFDFVGISDVTLMGIVAAGPSFWPAIASTRISCANTSAIGVGAGAVVDGVLDDDSLIYGQTSMQLYSVHVDTCGTAVAISGPSAVSTVNLDGKTGIGLYVENGGYGIVDSAGGYTLDAGIDIRLERGAEVQAQVNSLLDGGCVATMGSGSRVCRKMFVSGGGWTP